MDDEKLQETGVDTSSGFRFRSNDEPKRRGRKKGSRIINGRVINPAELAGREENVIGSSVGTGPDESETEFGQSESTKRKAKRKTEYIPSLDLRGLEALLFSIHTGFSILFASPHWALDQEEAAILAQSSVNVLKHYNVSFGGKIADWTNLVIIASMIYGPRLSKSFGKKEKQVKPSSEASDNTDSKIDPLNPLF
ncbi:MAG: hypothetical protein ACREAG_00785 [Nitrosopumilaceae archaeon]